MHVRNVHNTYLDYSDLASHFPELWPFVTSKFGRSIVDYKDPAALKTLTKALLSYFYNLQWELPGDYLIPPIPQRVNYIHCVADLLRPEGLFDRPPTGDQVRVLDIGAGASGIYCFLGASVYKWSFVGTDIDVDALCHAQNLVRKNKLRKLITLRPQKNPRRAFKDVIQPEERFAVCMCNPPFHETQAWAEKSNEMKWQNIESNSNGRNYGGRECEIVCDGGEVGFIFRMIKESAKTPSLCIWFTSLVAREKSVDAVTAFMDEYCTTWQVIRMVCGHNMKWIVCWSWISAGKRERRLRDLYVGMRLNIDWPMGCENVTFPATVARAKKRKIEVCFEDNDRRWTRLKTKHCWM